VINSTEKHLKISLSELFTGCVKTRKLFPKMVSRSSYFIYVYVNIFLCIHTYIYIKARIMPDFPGYGAWR
jgi:hypothetical protein